MFETRQGIKVGVIGLGYVGLSQAICCSKHAYSVVGVDRDREKIKALRQGKSCISYISDAEIKKFINSNQVSSNYEDLISCQIILVCVPTPLTNNHEPDYSFLDMAFEELIPQLNGQLVIIESTVGCGTTNQRILPFLESSGLQIGKDFFLAYSPERIDPGNRQHNAENGLKLVSGVTRQCLDLAVEFYKELGVAVVQVHSPEIAEMAKLLENSYRDINIAFINEMARVCHKWGVDVWAVIDAAATKPYGFQAFYPGPGVGGHCVPVDSVYYTHSARQHGIPVLLAETARTVNSAQPQYVVGRLEELLNAQGKMLANSKILYLGVTYKEDVNDLRESPSLKIIELLMKKNVRVSYHDPYIENIILSCGELQSVQLSESLVQEQDCLVIAVRHSSYEWPWFLKYSPLILDLTNVMGSYVNGQDQVKKVEKL